MKQNDVITIKKVLSNYFTEDMTETLIEEIIEHTDTDIDDLPIMDKPNAPVVPSLVDIITATGFLAQIAQGLAEDSDREEQLADQYNEDTFRRIAKMNREDAEALLRARAWLNTLHGMNLD